MEASVSAGGSASSSGGGSPASPASSGSSSSGQSGGSGSAGASEASTPRQQLPKNGNFGENGSSDDGASAAADDSADDGASAEPRTKPEPAKPKFKRKWQGAEVESDGEELARMLSDDYEHEFKGQDGQTIRGRWRDIERAMQKESGALGAMQRYNEMKAQIERDMQLGAKDIPAFAMSRLGVEDWESFVVQEAIKLRDRDIELEQLSKQNPREYHRRQREIAQQQLERKNALDKMRAEQEQTTRQQQEQQLAVRRAIGSQLEKDGVPVNNFTAAVAEAVLLEHLQAGHQLSPQQVSDLTRRQIVDFMHSHLDKLDDDSLLGFLGDARREKLRKLESDKARGRKKEERQEAAQSQPRQRSGEPKPMTDKEFRERFMR